MDAQRERRLTAVFRGLFGLPGLELRDELTARDVPGWDSLNHVSLMVEIEREFGVRFTSDEIGGLRCVGDLKALVEAKIPGPSRDLPSEGPAPEPSNDH